MHKTSRRNFGVVLIWGSKKSYYYLFILFKFGAEKYYPNLTKILFSTVL